MLLRQRVGHVFKYLPDYCEKFFLAHIHHFRRLISRQPVMQAIDKKEAVLAHCKHIYKLDKVKVEVQTVME